MELTQKISRGCPPFTTIETRIPIVSHCSHKSNHHVARTVLRSFLQHKLNHHGHKLRCNRKYKSTLTNGDFATNQQKTSQIAFTLLQNAATDHNCKSTGNCPNCYYMTMTAGQQS